MSLSPRWYIVNTSHPAYSAAIALADSQHTKWGRGALSISHSLVDSRAIVKVFEELPNWRSGTPWNQVPGFVLQVLDEVAQREFASGEYQTADWTPPPPE
jgi:hypothetical protein